MVEKPVWNVRAAETASSDTGLPFPLGLPDCAGPLRSDFTLGPAGIFSGCEPWFRLF